MSKTDFCLNKNKECRGVYNFIENNYLEKCYQLKCHGYHGYECEKDFCSSDKKTCKRFYQLNQLSMSLQMYRKPLGEGISKYIYFTSPVKECPAVEYELKHGDVCVNNKTCMYTERIIQLAANKKYLVCPCFGKMSYQCGLSHCAIHNRACDAFKQGQTPIKMIKCANFNIKLAQKFLFKKKNA